MTQSVTIMEVSPRDGLQNESVPFSTEQKLQLIDRALAAGCKRIEVASFESGWLGNNSWIRGTCQWGIMPANGLIYCPPQIVLLAVDLYKDFINEEGIAITPMPPLQSA